MDVCESLAIVGNHFVYYKNTHSFCLYCIKGFLPQGPDLKEKHAITPHITGRTKLVVLQSLFYTFHKDREQKHVDKNHYSYSFLTNGG